MEHDEHKEEPYRAEICLEVAALLTGSRQGTHGDAVTQLDHAQLIKECVGHRNSSKLSRTELEAIDMICVKLSRLVKGSPNMDHYRDIIGYAAIAAEARKLYGGE